MPLPTISLQPVGLWHAQSAEQVLKALDTNSQTGLSNRTATERQLLYGSNTLQVSRGRNQWQILLDQFRNLMLLMLIVVAVVSGGLALRMSHFPKDAIAILVIVLLNAVLGYVQESRAEGALLALKQLAAPTVRVRRDGQVKEISAADLVPGDILLIEAGNQLAADARLIESANLQVKEASLTGEAAAVQKLADHILAENTSLGDRTNCVFQGTEVLQGRAIAVVYATAMNTELGAIASLLSTVQPEPTPLQQRLEQLGKVLVLGALLLVSIVVALGSWLGAEPLELLETGLSMAVAIVPEGLPAMITVALAIGTQRMARRNALIRRLPAVETLGSVTTICSDKTGTLTENKMSVRELCTVEHNFTVSGEGYTPAGIFSLQGRAILPDDYRDLLLLLSAGVVCNDAVLQDNGGEWSIIGDPTEGSLLTVAGKAGIEQEAVKGLFCRCDEIPFTSERKRMSVVASVSPATTLPLHLETPYLMVTKGSPEILLPCCDSIFQSEGTALLNESKRQDILKAADSMASRGRRVLGFAYRPLTQPNISEADEEHLIWLGLMGQIDAPRLEVKKAVEQCKQAGIRPIMITGDHPLTAEAIAVELGISPANAQVITGQQLAQMGPAALFTALDRCSVFARVTPEQKLRLVEVLQKQAHIVAMTGDGVNDAPALKQSDIGVAMGICGTDVSKEASDMVLLNDNFVTIIAAVEEGRVVYDNIRSFIKYILGSNIGELITLAAAPLLQLGAVPLTPLQILWMNLVTDGFPALALAVEPGDPLVMQRPPHNPKESIFARGLGIYILRVGIVFGILTTIMMVIAYRYTPVIRPGELSPDRWKTMVFTTLCLAQMGHVIAIRSSRLTITQPLDHNPWLLLAVIVTTLSQFLLIYVGPLQRFFGTFALSIEDLSICVGFSLLLFVWLEAEKLVRQRNRNSQK